MRILWVKAGKLLPVDTGGKIRSYNLLRQLAPRHPTTLLSYYPGTVDHAYDDALAQEFRGSISIAMGGPESRMGTVLHYLACLPSRVPYAVRKFASAAVRDELQRAAEKRSADVVVCDFLAPSLNFAGPLRLPTALFQHNVESSLWQRQATHESNPLKRAAFTLEARRMLRYESATVNRFHHVVAVSEHDRSLMSAMTDAARISVAPTGVDLSQYRPLAGRESLEPVVTFLGSMDWEANVDGVRFFHREIWPAIRSAVPDAKFRIVGRRPDARVRALAEDPSVEVTGDVPSVLPHLEQTAVFVVPLRIGGGTRLKIYEAMAAGRAVVSTTIGAEGLDVNHPRDIVLADDPGTFSDAVIRLLRDRPARRELERAAADQAARFDWPQVVSQFEESLERTIQAAAESKNRA